jgi:predicted nucleic acid-binding protein
MRVVIVNVLVSRFLASTGAPAQLFEQWQRNAFELVVSESTLAELEKVLAYERISLRHQMSQEEIIRGQQLRRFAVLVQVTERIESSARIQRMTSSRMRGCWRRRHIVSGDAHLLHLREYRGIHILSPAAFLALLRSGIG